MNTTPSTTDAANADAAWAREQLGLPDVENAAAARALQRQLRAHEFLPPADWQACATSVLGHAPAGFNAAEAITIGRGDALREQIEDFAGEFFTLEPAARRSRWHELSAQCLRHAPLAARLDALLPGLDLLPAGLAADALPEMGELQTEILRLFSLRRSIQTLATLEVRSRVAQDRDRWEEAARLLETQHPEIAQLNGPLISELKNWRALEAEADRELRRVRARRKLDTKQGKRQSGPSDSNWMLWFFGIGVASLLGSFFNSATTPTPKLPLPSGYEFFSPEQKADFNRKLFQRAVRSPLQSVSPKPRTRRPVGGVGDPGLLLDSTNKAAAKSSNRPITARQKVPASRAAPRTSR